jgi:hypothetical protein
MSTSAPTSAPPRPTEPPAPVPAHGEDSEPLTGTPASATDAEAVEAALRNLVDSINSGNYSDAASLMTENFIQNVLEVSTRNDVPAYFEGAQPIDLQSVGNALSFADGRLSIDVVDMGLFGGTRQIGYARWFFRDEGGVYKLDDYVNLMFTESILPGAVVINVQLVDFAFALSGYTMAADTPVIFRATNNSSRGYEHAIDIVTLPAGTTAEQMIEGQLNPFEAVTEFVGGILVASGDTGDLALETLPPGTYFLICPMETPDGTPNFELGMVAEITVR